MLSEAYNEVNKLLAETEQERDAFRRATYIVDDLKRVIEDILEVFGNPLSSKNLIKQGTIRIGGYNLQCLGIVGVRFSKLGTQGYPKLEKITKEQLTDILNIYAPQPLEVLEIFVDEDATTVVVKLKGLK